MYEKCDKCRNPRAQYNEKTDKYLCVPCGDTDKDENKDSKNVSSKYLLFKKMAMDYKTILTNAKESRQRHTQMLNQSVTAVNYK